MTLCINVQGKGCIIRTVVRIVGMYRMSHVYNTKCSRLQTVSKK